jgi:biotin carboxyl carrier protein
MSDVEAHVAANVWKIECEVGQQVEEGDTLVVLEARKVEMRVTAEDRGEVKAIPVTEGQAVAEGDTLVTLEG